MAKTQYFNDTPILNPSEDNFGINEFSKNFAQSIRSFKSPIGVTFALNGAWGSGKSSAVNLIRHHLNDDIVSGKLAVIDYKCWWFRGEEALTLSFLQEVNKVIRDTLGEKSKDLLPRIGKSLLQAGAVVGPAVGLAGGGILGGALASGSMDFAKRFFSEKRTIEDLFQDLSEELAVKQKRYLIVIDDIDRLDPLESLAIFRLVKSIGRLPNIIYLLIFDRELAEKHIRERYPSEGPHYLEKIIQVSFELPLPARDDLSSAVLSNIESICGAAQDIEEARRFMNMYYDAVFPFINLPRDLIRLCNAIAAGWHPIASDVNKGDFIALEVIRLFEPRLYNEIRINKERVCGVRTSYGKTIDPEKEVQSFLDKVEERNRDRAKNALIRLFPIFESVAYSSDNISVWESERRACTKKHFDTYFRMSVGDDTLSMAYISEFIDKCGDGAYVKKEALDALSKIRKNGKSRLPVLLDELNVHSAKIEKEKFEPLISCLFQIADDIDREEDKERGTLAIGDNNLRMHWLIRKLTFDRCNLDERDKLFRDAIQNAQLGWTVDFVSSAEKNHFPRAGKVPEPPERCLVKKESLDQLKKVALDKIRASAKDNSLLIHRDILHILFRWKDYDPENGKEVGQWLAKHIEDEKSLAVLAKAFTSYSWTQNMGMFSLGDRVAVKRPRAAIDGLDKLLDIKRFREQLERVAVKTGSQLTKEEKDSVQAFLDAWRKREKRED